MLEMGVLPKLPEPVDGSLSMAAHFQIFKSENFQINPRLTHL